MPRLDSRVTQAENRVARTYMTTIVDRQHGLGICVIAVPIEAIPSDAILEPKRLVDGLGIRLRHRFPSPSEDMLRAALAGVLLDKNASAAISRADRLLRVSPRYPTRHLSTPLQHMVDRCASAEPVAVQEEGRSRYRNMCELLGENGDLWIASTTGRAGPVLVAFTDSAGVVLVARTGERAGVLALRLAEWLAPDGELRDEGNLT
jgi:hypothetical protein